MEAAIGNGFRINIRRRVVGAVKVTFTTAATVVPNIHGYVGSVDILLCSVYTKD